MLRIMLCISSIHISNSLLIIIYFQNDLWLHTLIFGILRFCIDSEFFLKDKAYAIQAVM